MRGIWIATPFALALWALIFWCAWPLIGRPRLEVGQIPQHVEFVR